MRLTRPGEAAWSAALADSRLGDLPFTQTVAWAEHKAHGGWSPLRLMIEDEHGHWIAISLLTRPLPAGLGRFAYAARGPIMVAPEPAVATALLGAIGAELRQLRAEGVSLLRFEPPTPTALGSDLDPVHPPLAARAPLCEPYRAIAVPCGALQPRSSSIVDLQGGMTTVRSRYKASQRSTLRTAERHGVQVRDGRLDDLPAFAEVMAATAARAGFAGRDPASYHSLLTTHGSAAELLLAETADLGVIAGLLLVHTRTTTTYLYAGSSDAGSAMRATYTLMDAALQRASARGSVRFDLWGLPTAGIAAFKAGWGGQAVAYAGGMEVIVDPWRGRLAAAALRLRGGGRA